MGSGAVSHHFTNWLGNEVRRVVDALGRPSAWIDSFRRTTRIAGSDLTGGCGPCGAAMGLPSRITDPVHGVTSFGHDAVGNLTNVTDALSHAVTYREDSEPQTRAAVWSDFRRLKHFHKRVTYVTAL